MMATVLLKNDKIAKAIFQNMHVDIQFHAKIYLSIKGMKVIIINY